MITKVQLPMARGVAGARRQPGAALRAVDGRHRRPGRRAARSATSWSPGSRQVRDCRQGARRRRRHRAARHHARPDHPGARYASGREGPSEDTRHDSARSATCRRPRQAMTDRTRHAVPLSVAPGSPRSCGALVASRLRAAVDRRRDQANGAGAAARTAATSTSPSTRGSATRPTPHVVGVRGQAEARLHGDYKDLKEEVSWQGFGTGAVDASWRTGATPTW